jgi:hypothetical protein
MNKATPKIIFASGLSGLFLFVAKALAQTGDVSPAATEHTANIVSASFYQVINNPASLTVICFLCVVAWLLDDLPFINSRYVAHISVIIGASIYWAFAGLDSVPKSYPVPHAVLVVNGTICGFAAFIIHRQAIARLISFVRARNGTGNMDFIRNNQPPTNP